MPADARAALVELLRDSATRLMVRDVVELCAKVADEAVERPHDWESRSPGRAIRACLAEAEKP